MPECSRAPKRSFCGYTLPFFEGVELQGAYRDTLGV